MVQALIILIVIEVCCIGKLPMIKLFETNHNFYFEVEITTFKIRLIFTCPVIECLPPVIEMFCKRRLMHYQKSSKQCVGGAKFIWTVVFDAALMY